MLSLQNFAMIYSEVDQVVLIFVVVFFTIFIVIVVIIISSIVVVVVSHLAVWLWLTYGDGDG